MISIILAGFLAVAILIIARNVKVIRIKNRVIDNLCRDNHDLFNGRKKEVLDRMAKHAEKTNPGTIEAIKRQQGARAMAEKG